MHYMMAAAAGASIALAGLAAGYFTGPMQVAIVLAMVVVAAIFVIKEG